MAKRKLLNSEREIILPKTLQHVFKDVLPVAYSFLLPLEEHEPTKRQLASKALISYGTIAHLNGLLNTGYQL